MLHSTKTSRLNLSFVIGIIVCSICVGAILFSCSKNGDPVIEVKKSSDKLILTFGFNQAENPLLYQDFIGTINGNNVLVSIPSGFEISALKATFTVSAKTTVKVGSVVQQDKLTVNNFTSSIVYTITAEDGTSQSYTVSIVCSDKALLSFGFLKADNSSINEDCTGVIAGSSVSLLVSSTADLSQLKAMFTTSPKATVKVGDIVQQSKVTITSFVVPVVYSVIAEDGTKQDFVVTVTRKSGAKDLLSFGLNKADNPYLVSDCTGIINGTNVHVMVPFKTDLAAFKASFSISPKSSIKVGLVVQQDKVTVNNFANPVTYTITAEDGSSINYLVTITWAPNREKELLTFGFFKSRNGSLPYDLPGVIDPTTKRVLCTLPAGVGRTNLIATFSLSERAVAKVGTMAQTSDVTSNNFTSNLSYTIQAEDASTSIYTIELVGESLPNINQSRIDSKILALNLHRYPSPVQKLFSSVQVVPIYTTAFLGQKPTSSMPFDAGYIGGDGKIYVTTPFSNEQKAVFKDATQAAIYYMCQLFLANYYMKNVFPIWFKYGMAAFEAGLTISDDVIKSSIMKYGGQLPSLSTLNDPQLFASNNGIALAYMWGEFMAVSKCWQYYDIIDVNSQTIVVAPYWSGVGSLDNMYTIWTRYIHYRILETNSLKRGRMQGESSHFRFYCADKDAFCIPGFTDIIEKAFTNYSNLYGISFPEKLIFGFGPECEVALIDGVPCSNRYTGGTGWVSGMACSSPNSLNDMYMWDHLLRHELAHCFVSRLYPSGFQPTAWLSEGAAEFLTYGVMDQARINECKPQVKEAMNKAIGLFGHRPTYDETRIYPGNPYYDYYILGQVFLNFIHQKGGISGVKGVLSNAEEGIRALGFANHDECMNAFYQYYDSVWAN